MLTRQSKIRIRKSKEVLRGKDDNFTRPEEGEIHPKDLIVMDC